MYCREIGSLICRCHFEPPDLESLRVTELNLKLISGLGMTVKVKTVGTRVAVETVIKAQLAVQMEVRMLVVSDREQAPEQEEAVLVVGELAVELVVGSVAGSVVGDLEEVATGGSFRISTIYQWGGFTRCL